MVPARRQVGAWISAALRFAAHRPYPALGLGFAAGYVLGGGLFTPLTARVAGTTALIGRFPEVQLRLAGALGQGLLSQFNTRRSTRSTPKSRRSTS